MTIPQDYGEGRARRSPSILLAEEDPWVRENLTSLLKQRGCDLVICQDGVVLLNAINCLFLPGPQARIDLILCDNRLPGVDGLELLRGMQNYIGFPPVILMAARRDDDAETLGYELGAAAVIHKPIDQDELLAAVNEQLPPDCLPVCAHAA